MGIYLKNINKPNNCMSCPLHHMIGQYHYCQAFKPYLYMKEFKKFDIKDDCPIIEIPPHGRLIDADALKEAFCGNCFADEKPMECSEPCMDMRIILDTPTIIEAEEDKNMSLYDKVCNQKIRDGYESICWTCIHLKVCFAKDNQPCIECDQYRQA